MAWMQKLYETYERCKGREPAGSEHLLEPIAHTTQQAHLEITIDGDGNFIRAEKLDGIPTLMPATEDSAARSGTSPPPHPLCDKIKYCARDYVSSEEEENSPFRKYVDQLAQWVASKYGHPKINAILAYVQRRNLIADLEKSGLYRPGDKISNNISDIGEGVVRWRVEIPGVCDPTTWGDESLIEAWISYYTSDPHRHGLCFIQGEKVALARKQPRNIRRGGDGAKLISSDDKSGFTYIGRFLDAEQAASIGYEGTQKAHNALRWLIQRQGTFLDPKRQTVIVAWAVGGARIPDPCQDTLALCGVGGSAPADLIGDVGQTDARLLGRAMKGYRAELDPAEDVVVMGLGSATPGRMAISFYRELKGADFLDRIEGWHERCAWHQSLGTEQEDDGKKVSRRFIGAPAPRHIAEAAFGRRLDEKLLRATVERLLPCIVDGQPVPRDLVVSTVHRASTRIGLARSKGGWGWEFEKCLGIACALFRGAYQERGYQMALEEERKTRDYLFGRLLAVAERIEDSALSIAKESRDTTAAKLMQRFADRPMSAWRVIETALPPYKARLRANWPGFLINMEKLLDQIMADFDAKDFVSDRPLSGEFLLGYHCQRQAIFAKGGGQSATDDNQSTNS